MSELTPCNYCSLRDIRRRAKARGVVVTTVPDNTGWTSVYVHPPDADLPEDDDHDGESPYRVASMMKVPDHCVC